MFIPILVVASTLSTGGHIQQAEELSTTLKDGLWPKIYGPLADESIFLCYQPVPWKGDMQFRVINTRANIVRSGSFPVSKIPVGLNEKSEVVFYDYDSRFSTCREQNTMYSEPSTMERVCGEFSFWRSGKTSLNVLGMRGYRLDVDLKYEPGAFDVSPSGKLMVVSSAVDYSRKVEHSSSVDVFDLVTKRRVRTITIKDLVILERVTDDIRFYDEDHLVLLVKPDAGAEVPKKELKHLTSATDIGVRSSVWLVLANVTSGRVKIVATVDIYRPYELGGYPANAIVPLANQKRVAVLSGNRLWRISIE